MKVRIKEHFLTRMAARIGESEPNCPRCGRTCHNGAIFRLIEDYPILMTRCHQCGHWPLNEGMVEAIALAVALEKRNPYLALVMKYYLLGFREPASVEKMRELVDTTPMPGIYHDVYHTYFPLKELTDV